MFFTLFFHQDEGDMLQAQIDFKVHEHLGPSMEEVRDFFCKKGYPVEEGEVFYFYYQSMDWRNERGNAVTDWKAAASDWLWNLDN